MNIRDRKSGLSVHFKTTDPEVISIRLAELFSFMKNAGDIFWGSGESNKRHSAAVDATGKTIANFQGNNGKKVSIKKAMRLMIEIVGKEQVPIKEINEIMRIIDGAITKGSDVPPTEVGGFFSALL